MASRSMLQTTRIPTARVSYEATKAKSSPAPCCSKQVWDYHFDPQTNVIDVHISRLRSKIDKGFDKPLLQTVRGAGYRLG